MKIKKYLSICISALLLFTALSGCIGNSDNPNKITVVLDWTPNTNHTGMYVAQELGYYADQNLEVEIMQPPEDGAPALVASGKAQFGIDFQESFGPALAADSPLPITAVGAILSHNTSGIVSIKSANINSPKDLEGKRFSAWSAPLVDAIMRTVIEKDGGDPAKVDILPGSVTDVVSALKANMDAVWIYEGWDGVALTLSDLDVNYMSFADLDERFDFYTPIIIASNDYLESSPDQAKAFMSATAKGYEYAIENPEEAAKILLKYAPELSEDMVIASQQYLADKYKADAPYWGYIDSARWARFYDWMYDQELMTVQLGESGFTNEFLPEA